MNYRNLITALAIAALITVAATAAGCATNINPTATPTPIAVKQTVSGNNTTVSSAGFNITFPKTLKNDTSTNASESVRVYIYLASNNTIDGVNVGTEPMTSNATLDDLAIYYVSKVNDFPNYQKLSNQTITFAGKPAYRIVWQATVPVQLNQTAVQNVTLKVMQTYVINDNTAYTVTYKAIPSDYDTYLAQAQQIMNSFELV